MGVDGTRRNRYNLFHVETYRSGHNGADSKSVCLSGHAGSNPAVSVLDYPMLGESFFICAGPHRKICGESSMRAARRVGRISPLLD